MRRSVPVPAAVLLLALLVSISWAQRAGRQPLTKSNSTHADVSYGPHRQQVFDIWLANSAQPTPLVMFIHGGGFCSGSKDDISARTIRRYVKQGISIASIEYRFAQHEPLPAAHEDVVRAVQLIRSKAGEWNLDKQRFGAFGGSAGAQLCMYLAFHDDLADPGSNDPIARESTRLRCVGSGSGQPTMDFDWWEQHIPGYVKPAGEGSNIFGPLTEDEMAAVVDDIAALSQISSDDPPIWMSYTMSPDDAPPADPEDVKGWQLHHVSFGIALKERTDALGVEGVLLYPGETDPFRGRDRFMIGKLTAP